MTLGAGPPSSHIFQAGWKLFLLLAWCVKAQTFLHSQVTLLTTRALTMLFSGGLAAVC